MQVPSRDFPFVMPERFNQASTEVGFFSLSSSFSFVFYFLILRRRHAGFIFPALFSRFFLVYFTFLILRRRLSVFPSSVSIYLLCIFYFLGVIGGLFPLLPFTGQDRPPYCFAAPDDNKNRIQYNKSQRNNNGSILSAFHFFKSSPFTFSICLSGGYKGGEAPIIAIFRIGQIRRQ